MTTLAVLAAALLGGCAGSYQARSVDLKPDTILVSPDVYQKGTGDQVLYRYVNQAVDWKQYDKVMIEPVVIYKEAELDKDQLQNYQLLANNAYNYLTKEMGTQATIVTTPEPGTIKFQLAIVDAEKSAPVRNIISTIVPQAAVISGLKYLVTGKMMAVGEITAEARLTDAMTGQLLGAGYDRRVGGKDLGESFNGWYNADSAMQFWAKKAAWFLCDSKGGTNCVKPEN
jgi:hypothetical protein